MSNKNTEIVYKKPTVLNVHKNEKSFLADKIPLSTPFTVLVSVSEYCNLKCEFCVFGCKTQSSIFEAFKKGQSMMSLDTFKKITESFKLFDKKLKLVKFVGNGESLTNKEFPKMVRILKESETAERLHLVTNGLLLTPELSLELVDAGLDEVQISINGLNNDDYKRVTGTNVDFDMLVRNIRFLYENRKQCKIFCKIVDVAVKDREKEFREIFESISDLAVIEYIYPMYKAVDYESNDGTISMLGEKIERFVKVCCIPFFQMTVVPNGDITLCIADILNELKFGNIYDVDFIDVWNGNKLNEFRKLNLEGRISEHKICYECYLKHACVVNFEGNRLDDDAERLLNSYYKGF